MLARKSLLHLASILCCCLALQAQDLDGPRHMFNDPLLDNMVGSWTLSGTILGRPAKHSLDAEWVLNHQFLRIHEKDLAGPADISPAYEAIVMVGYDNTSERYVVHWMDIYGGRYSETLGYGSRAGSEMALNFEYPDGPFHTTFRWKPESKQWEWTMQQKNKAGSWTQFADLILAPGGRK
jgi:hypothetical protein